MMQAMSRRALRIAAVSVVGVVLVAALDAVTICVLVRRLRRFLVAVEVVPRST